MCPLDLDSGHELKQAANNGPAAGSGGNKWSVIGHRSVSEVPVGSATSNRIRWRSGRLRYATGRKWVSLGSLWAGGAWRGGGVRKRAVHLERTRFAFNVWDENFEQTRR